MQTPMTARAAGPSDLDRIAALSGELHAAEGVAIPADQHRRAIRTLIEQPSIGAMLVAEIDGEVIGFAAIAFGFSIEFGGRDGFLDEIVIDRAHRGRGHGAALIAHAKSTLARQGVLALHLEVNLDNPRALRLYRKLGFVLRDGYKLMSAPL